MLRSLKFVAILLLALGVTWFVAEGIYFLSILLKPLTPFMRYIERIFLHVIFIALSIFVAWGITFDTKKK